MTELDLAARGVAHFQDAGWDVYQEVAIGSRTIDMVCVQGPLLWVIEVKVSASLKVLEQAHSSLGQAHRVSVLVEHANRFFVTVAQVMGVGVFSAGSNWREWAKPRFYRHSAGRLRRALNEQQKTYCPAGAQSGRWSPWKYTMDQAVAYIRANPGCTTKQVVDGIKHHYGHASTAISCVRQWLQYDPRIRAEKVNGRLVWALTEP